MRSKPLTKSQEHGICCEWVRDPHTDKCRLQIQTKYNVLFLPVYCSYHCWQVSANRPRVHVCVFCTLM